MPKIGLFQTEHRQNNFCAFLQKQQWEHPHAPLITYPSNGASTGPNYSCLTTDSFAELTGALAHNFLQLGIREGSVVLVALPYSLPQLISAFALLRLGAPVMTLAAQGPSDDKIFSNYSPVAAIITSDIESALTHNLKKIFPNMLVIGFENHRARNYHYFPDLLRAKMTAEICSVVQNHPAIIALDPSKNLSLIHTHEQLAKQCHALKKVFPEEGLVFNHPVLMDQLNSSLFAIAMGIPFQMIDQALPTGDDRQFWLPPSSIETHLTQDQFYGDTLLIQGIPSHSILQAVKKRFRKVHYLIGDPWCFPFGIGDGKTNKLISLVNYKLLRMGHPKPLKINDISDWTPYLCLPGERGELWITCDHLVRDFQSSNPELSHHFIEDDFSICWYHPGIFAKTSDQIHFDFS